MPVSSLTDPFIEDARDLLDTGFEHGGMLTLVGECEVEYDGRASSYLPPGERLITGPRTYINTPSSSPMRPSTP